MSAQITDVEPIERLAEKVKGLIGLLGRTRNELSQTIEDNRRLNQEVERLRAELIDAKRADDDLSELQAERTVIRSRVTQMLEQLDALKV